jgi:hypothetical protein
VTEQPIVWQTLGIAATRDVASIRKAYASRLKECHPEEDPAGFQRLRAAYETALNMARSAIAAAPSERPTGLSAPTAPAIHDPASSVAAAPMEAEGDQKQFEAALGNLERLLKGPADANKETLERALEAILNNPGALHVGNWSGLDRRLAQLLLESIPRSDAIAATVVQRLGWNHADVATRRAKEVMAVVTRVADLEVVAKLRVGTDPDARAFQLLSRPAPTSRLVRRVKVFFVDQAVRDFLQKTVPARPTLALWLDKASVTTWMAIFGRPYVTRRALLAMPIFSVIALLATLIAGNNGVIAQERVGTALLSAIFAGPILAVLKVYAFSWPILLVLRRLKGKAPPRWVRLGWLPASVASVVVVSIAGRSWPVVVLSLILSAGLLVWSSVAAYPVFIAEGLAFSQKLRLSFARNRVTLVWMVVVVWAVGLPAGIATAGALGASEIAGIVIAKILTLDVAARVRHCFMGALLMVALAALAALWWDDGSPRLIGFSTALVTTTVLLLRPALSALRSKVVQAWMIGIFPVYLLATLFASAGKGVLLNARFTTQFAGSFLLIGAAIAIVSYLIQEAISTRARANTDGSEDPFTRFFDQESPVLPVTLGLALLGGGGYGLLVLSNYTGMDWIFYCAVAGTGVFVLKRTFASPE